MAEMCVSIGQVKRDISDLVNRVAYGGNRVILTSRGKPKAALISMDDYALLQERVGPDLASWQAWVEESAVLSADILERRDGEPPDAEALWRSARADLEARDERLAGR